MPPRRRYLVVALPLPSLVESHIIINIASTSHCTNLASHQPHIAQPSSTLHHHQPSSTSYRHHQHRHLDCILSVRFALLNRSKDRLNIHIIISFHKENRIIEKAVVIEVFGLISRHQSLLILSFPSNHSVKSNSISCQVAIWIVSGVFTWTMEYSYRPLCVAMASLRSHLWGTLKIWHSMLCNFWASQISVETDSFSSRSAQNIGYLWKHSFWSRVLSVLIPLGDSLDFVSFSFKYINR